MPDDTNNTAPSDDELARTIESLEWRKGNLLCKHRHGCRCCWCHCAASSYALLRRYPAVFWRKTNGP